MDITQQQARENNVMYTVDFVRNDQSLGEVDNDDVHPESSNPAVMTMLTQTPVDDPAGGKHYQVVYELHPVVGNATPSGFGDADLGDGERMVAWSGEVINVVADEVTNAVVSTGVLVPKPVV